MSRAAIIVDNLSKSYRLGVESRPADSIREAVSQALTSPLRRFRESAEARADSAETFWALKDVSFEVRPGEVMGIIGRNGAGKSTLLKILSRIVEPTSGCIRLRGRIASLLEVGTGFHPELTGRENVYLNGSILGMKHVEIARNFDEIVAFSGVEKFIDTPVKRYSSGMYVRLAFAVAAHLEPEILIVDEVLAVGDAEFQKKCISKMEQVSREDGRTILLVTHTMASIEALCDRAVYLDRGAVGCVGPAREIVSHYLANMSRETESGMPLADRIDRTGNGAIRLTSFHIEDEQGCPVTHVASGRDVTFVFGFEAPGHEPVDDVDMGISIHAGYETTLFVYYGSYSGDTFRVDRRSGSFRCTISRLPLVPGQYQVGARVTAGGMEADWPRDRAGSFTVETGDFYRSGRPGCEHPTSFLVDGKWALQ